MNESNKSKGVDVLEYYTDMLLKNLDFATSREERRRLIWCAIYGHYQERESTRLSPSSEGVTDFSFKYCQREIEGNDKCEQQCKHCAEYYKPLEAEGEQTDKQYIEFLQKKLHEAEIKLIEQAEGAEQTAEGLTKKQKCEIIREMVNEVAETDIGTVEVYAAIYDKYFQPKGEPQEAEAVPFHYGRGRRAVANEMIDFVRKEIAEIKKDSPEPNSPRQISNGGKLKALNVVLQRLLAKLEKSEKVKCRTISIPEAGEDLEDTEKPTEDEEIANRVTIIKEEKRDINPPFIQP